jgi:hypothetical protein
MQLVASAMGGYLAGRLRTKWVGIHTDEVFFRDTAHGFLSWAVGVVVSAAFLASAAASLLGGNAEVGSAPLVAATMGGDTTAGISARINKLNASPSAYATDVLLRSDTSAREGNDASIHEEVSRIFANALKQNDLSTSDKEYLSKLTAARTGLNAQDAAKRVTDVFAQLRRAEVEATQAVDDARKAAAQLALWTFLALLIGAFSASYAATIGGRQRDRVVEA